MFIPKECRRLAEVDFPLAAVNRACGRENNRKVRPENNHLSLLHTWWARRPLASCRSVLLGILLPDPADEHCPDDFKTAARKVLNRFRRVGPNDYDLRRALTAFLADASDSELIGSGAYRDAVRELVQAAWPDTPLVFDPFAGGGSIPLEALRIGCDAAASDLNPVAWLLLKVTLEWSARYQQELLDLFERWSAWVLEQTRRRLAPYYPPDEQGRQPLAYLWARTVQCESPGCGATIPLVRNLRLSQAHGRAKALRISYPMGSLNPRIEVFEPGSPEDVMPGTVARFRATCPRCRQATARERVQAQLRERRGGTRDAVLLAVVREKPGSRGKDYYDPDPKDLEALRRADSDARQVKIEMPLFPAGDTRAFPPYPYGITNWADLLTPRQTLSRWVIHEVIEDALKRAGKETRDQELLTALAACLCAAASDNAQYHTSLCVWLSEGVKSIFIQGSGVPMRADFVEGNPLSPNCEGLRYSVESVAGALRGLIAAHHRPSSPLLGNALDPLLPNESVSAVFTDPPYYNSIPYAHLADFFYGWLRLGLRGRIPGVFDRTETEKATEITKNLAVENGGGRHDQRWYEEKMTAALAQARGSLVPEGIGAVIFAHKDTGAWESLVSALIQSGWVVTASWPVLTERRQRMRGQGYAALESSVHLVCRPRPGDAPVGEWGEVLQELPQRVGDWMERLQAEGVRGADLVFACIGPALEVFSRYSWVETAEGREVPLAEFLAKVWEVVGRAALEQVLGTAEARARNGAAGVLEEDARLTALFLWTLQSTEINSSNGENSVVADSEQDGIDEGSEPDNEGINNGAKKKKGYRLTYDLVRRFAQPLGIHIEAWEGRIIATEKGVVRLLPVSARAKALFGKEGAAAVASRIEAARRGPVQLSLFPLDEAAALPGIGVPKKDRAHTQTADAMPEQALKTRRDATTLDRVHTAMLLQADGQANALRALLQVEIQRGPDFLRLANALSALYPRESEEKRLLDAMLLGVPR